MMDLGCLGIWGWLGEAAGRKGATVGGLNIMCSPVIIGARRKVGSYFQPTYPSLEGDLAVKTLEACSRPAARQASTEYT